MITDEIRILTNLRVFLSRAQLAATEIPVYTEAYQWVDQRLAERVAQAEDEARPPAA